MFEKKPGFQYVEAPEIKLYGIRKIVILGDVGCTGFNDESKNILGRILQQKPDLFFILGDLVFTGAEKEFREIVEFCNTRVEVPVFALCGNHDVLNYSRFLGRKSYALVLEERVCVFLCNAEGHFLDESLHLLSLELEKYKEKKFLVLMHMPPFAYGCRSGLGLDEWDRLKKVMEPHLDRIEQVFCGHIHGFQEYRMDGYSVTVTAGGGAAMIYPLSPPARPLYHSITVLCHGDRSPDIEIIPRGMDFDQTEDRNPDSMASQR